MFLKAMSNTVDVYLPLLLLLLYLYIYLYVFIGETSP